MREILELPVDSQSKEYWDTGLDAHRLLGVDKKKEEQFRVKANKIHFLFEKGILNKHDEKTGVDKEIKLYDDLSKSFTGGAEFRFKHQDVELLINVLDAMQNILQNNNKVVLNQLPYRTFDDLIKALTAYENKTKEEKDQIKNNLSTIVGIGQQFNMLLAA